jgi:predicted RNA binding protein YcfA (HicA-like mRNA interferase family)
MNAREVNRRIEKLGGVQVSQVGSHRKYQADRTDGNGTCQTIVPQHKGRDIRPGTLASIEKQMEPAFGKGWLK